jgi:diaminohydroxyphosphoribosylaminopyrimidine deaminase/5-amino-6-(5-phosphoribosylamino)uracil reductase
MKRCLELATRGEGRVAPNPMVGAVLVHEGRIIGEGYHRQFGKAHAEVNCLESVRPEDSGLIKHSVLYVSLEPCSHYGKTPPCADLIIEKGIPEVVIGCLDPNVLVAGKGLEKLTRAGLKTTTGILEREARELNRRFFLFQNEKRPYVVLKWAQSLDGKISGTGDTRTLISNPQTNRIVHKWRAQEAAILVGTNTALKDDPELSTRFWPGADPIRLVLDRELKLPVSLKMFSGQRTIVFNLHKHEEIGSVSYFQITANVNPVHQILNALYQLNIQSVLVEGGSYLLQSFINAEAWDEARVICNEEMVIGQGIPAPVLADHQLVRSLAILSDRIRIFRFQKSGFSGEAFNLSNKIS